jgi:hypothetical protein
MQSNEGIRRIESGTINKKPYGLGPAIQTATDPNGYKYANYVGYSRFLKGGEDGIDENTLEFSDQVVNYAYYTDVVKTYVLPYYFDHGTKLSDREDLNVKSINENLKRVLKGFEAKDINANDVQYTLSSDPGNGGYDYTPLPQFNPDTNVIDIGYKHVQNEKKYLKFLNPDRFKRSYTLDPIPEENGENNNLGFAGVQRSDKINMFGVLGAEDIIKGNYDSYKSDIIAFFFYDVVNQKFIPFRATVKGISESMTAEWSDVSYIGRADKLFTYKGFQRTLQFGFSIHINTIKELLPTWTRINYLAGLVKPANYTGNGNQLNFSRFIIPPMIKFTIGDLYKNQPAVMTSCGVSIPEDAIWETLGEDGANSGHRQKDWNYLNGVISWKNSKGKYAQLPKSVDISISVNLLEKEKPVTGGSQYGDVYRDSNLKNIINTPGPFSEKLIVANV